MTPLFGHDQAVAAFREGLDSGRLHHAWLISGPEGIGKASFAKAAGQWLIAGAREASSSFQVEASPGARLLAAGTHPDFKIVEREIWEEGKKDQLKPEDKRTDSDQPARSIRVIQIRWLRAMLANKPALSPWRVIIVDAAEDLETGAANALLKSLEEPPPSTVFLLVSHAADRLLPTIRSRCRHLRLSPLDDAAMTSALEAALPDAPETEIDSLRQVGQGSPGRALAFRGLDINALDAAMRELAAAGDPTNARRIKLASALSLKAAQPRYEAFLARAPSLIAATALERRGPALAQALALYERASDLASGAVRLSLEPQSVVFELCGMLAALAPAPARTAG